jgi:hypothetical protein
VPNSRDDYDLSFQGDPGDPFAGPNGGVFGGALGFLFTNAAPGYVLNMRRTTSLALTSTNHGQGDCLLSKPFLTKETTMPNDRRLIDWIYQIIPLEDRESLNLTFGMVNASDSAPPRRDDFAQGYDSTVHDLRGLGYYMRLVQSV